MFLQTAVATARTSALLNSTQQRMYPKMSSVFSKYSPLFHSQLILSICTKMLLAIILLQVQPCGVLKSWCSTGLRVRFAFGSLHKGVEMQLWPQISIRTARSPITAWKSMKLMLRYPPKCFQSIGLDCPDIQRLRGGSCLEVYIISAFSQECELHLELMITIHHCPAWISRASVLASMH